MAIIRILGLIFANSIESRDPVTDYYQSRATDEFTVGILCIAGALGLLIWAAIIWWRD